MEFSRLYNYVRSRQVEGTYNANPKAGNWVVTSMRVGYGWGAVEEAVFPYPQDASQWPPQQEPPGLDERAKNWRTGPYQRVRNPIDAKRALANEILVLVALEMSSDWRNAPGGVIPFPPKQPMIGSHSVDLVGYDDDRKSFIFRNSWGVGWGDKGYGYLPYGYFDGHLQEAWIFAGTPAPPATKSSSALISRAWATPSLLGGVLHAIELYAPAQDERVGWAFMVSRDGFLDIEELFVRPQYRGTGKGTMLATLVAERASKEGLNLRLWLPHVDANSANLPAVKKIVSELRLHMRPSGCRWADSLAA